MGGLETVEVWRPVARALRAQKVTASDKPWLLGGSFYLRDCTTDDTVHECGTMG